MIEDDRRISTSSQTCYQETEKILYPRTLHKTYKKVRDQRRGNSKNFNLDFNKFQLNEKGLQEFAIVSKVPKSPLLMPFLPDIKEKSIDFFGNHSSHKQRFTSINLKNNEKKEKIAKSIRKKKNLSADINEELFMENPKSAYKRKVREYTMHKTFFDIFLELSEKSKNRVNGNCDIFSNLVNFN